jgi:predicted permease
VDFAERRRREPRYAGPLGALRYWGALAADVARTAPAARLQPPNEIFPLPEDDAVATFAQDLRYAARGLARRPGFTAVVALTLALGIGANAAIFSVVNAVLLQRLPWPDADRLVAVVSRTVAGDEGGVSYPDFLALRAGAPALEEVGVVRGQSVTLTGVERPDRLVGVFATAGALRIFGATMAVGRSFAAEETEAGTVAPVAILSHATWRARFGGDPAVVGRSLTLNGRPVTVVGVAAEGLVTPLGVPDVWLPLPYYPNAGGLERGDGSLLMYGRLAPGATRATADAQLAAVMRRLAAEFPATNRDLGAAALDLKASIVDGDRQSLMLLMGAVAVLLFIACLNVASLQLARALARRRETAVRAALGATGSRLARQLLTESLALAALGGALGVALGWAAVRALARTVAEELPAFGGVRLDGRVLALAALATLGAAVLAGLLPAWRGSRLAAGAGLGAREAGASRGALRGRSALVVGQMALSVVLLAGAGLLAGSLRELRRVRPGFDAANLLTFEFRLPATKYDTPEKITAMFERTLASLREVPGVRAAALVRAVPLGGNGEWAPASFDGRPAEDPASALSVQVNVVSDGYFAAAGLPLRAGREFTARDDARAPMVAVVSEALARRAWPGESPLGKRLRVPGWPDWATVVGVADGAKHTTMAAPLQPQAYVSFRQRPLIFTGAVVRTTGDPMARAEAVRRAVWRVDPDQPVWRMRPMEEIVAESTGAARALAALTGAFALVALTLAAVGVFGVMSFLVTQRRREMGIRVALGARGGQVAAMVVRHGLRLTAAALGLGLAGALAAGRAVASQLYGVSPGDPATLGGVALVLALAALAACWLPARRAGRVDPKVSLTAE